MLNVALTSEIITAEPAPALDRPYVKLTASDQARLNLVQSVFDYYLREPIVEWKDLGAGPGQPVRDERAGSEPGSLGHGGGYIIEGEVVKFLARSTTIPSSKRGAMIIPGFKAHALVQPNPGRNLAEVLRQPWVFLTLGVELPANFPDDTTGHETRLNAAEKELDYLNLIAFQVGRDVFLRWWSGPALVREGGKRYLEQHGILDTIRHSLS